MSAICDAHKKMGVELLYNSLHRKFNQLEINWVGSQLNLSFHFPSVLFCGQPGQQSRQFWKFSFFCWLLNIIIICDNNKNEVNWFI